MNEDTFNISKANEIQETVALGHAVVDGSKAITEEDMEKIEKSSGNVFEDIGAKEANEKLKEAQRDYLASLGIRPDGRRIADPRWVLESIQKGVPHWRFDWNEHEKSQKYPPAELRRLRAERGVGSSKLHKKNLTS